MGFNLQAAKAPLLHDLNFKNVVHSMPILAAALPGWLISFCCAGAVLPILNHLYQVVLSSGFGRDKKGNKKVPKVIRAKLDNGGVIVGELFWEASSYLLSYCCRRYDSHLGSILGEAGERYLIAVSGFLEM